MFCVTCLAFIRYQANHPSARPLMWVQLEPSSVQKPNKNKEDEQHRIVQSNAGHETKEAAPNAFLGEKTRVVDRETVNNKKVVQMGHTSLPDKTLTPPREDAKQAQNQPKPKGDNAADKTKPLANLGLAILPEERHKGATEALNKDEPQWANIGAQPQDYIDGIKASDRTALNTREYLYFGYHQRIRQRLELEWTRMLREVLIRFYKSGRQLASDTEYTTRLVVILNSRGEITKVKVLSISGTQELDDVAIQAFNRAGPFPNPPRGLVRNGEIEVPWELKLRS